MIDASGRQAAFARQQGARLRWFDRLMAALMFFPATGQDTTTLVESCAWGWSYSSLLPDQRLVVAVMSDADLVKTHQLQRTDRWLAALRELRWTRERLGTAWPEAAPLVCSARTQSLDRSIGPGWLAAGDAASAWDPLSGQGIAKALRHGVLAAYATWDALNGRAEGLRRYAALIEHEFASYLTTWHEYYAHERRWPDACFWQRRRAEHGSTAI